MKIVTPNYKDRSSPFKWLIRDENESVEEAKAFKEVKTSGGFKFGPSSVVESGFGCGVVAKVEKAEGIDPEVVEGATKIKFDGGHSFYVEKDPLQIVKDGKALSLRSDGSIFYS